MSSTHAVRRTTTLLGASVAASLAVTLGPVAVSAHAAAPEPTPPIKVTQNYDESRIDDGIYCPGNDATWWRRFHVADDHGAAGGFHVTSVDFLVHPQTTDAVDSLVGVHAIDPEDPLQLSHLETLTTVSHTVAAAGSDLAQAVAVDAWVPAGKHMVVSVSSQIDAGETMLVATNTAPELRESYVSASACLGDPQPRTGTSVGFPDAHLLIHAYGKAGECLAAEAEQGHRASSADAAEQVIKQARAARGQAHKSLTKARKVHRKAATKHGWHSPQEKQAARAKRKALRAKARAHATVLKVRPANKAAKAEFREAKQTVATECAQPQLPPTPSPRSTPRTSASQGGQALSDRTRTGSGSIMLSPAGTSQR